MFLLSALLSLVPSVSPAGSPVQSVQADPRPRNVAILVLLAVPLVGLPPFSRNGALNAYCIWVVALVVEIAILAYAVRARRQGPAPLPPPVRSPRESSAG